MTEARMSFLYNIAMLHQSENVTSKKFRSFYLMRSQEITGGYGLPNKFFSNKMRCPHCCLEWSNTADVKIKPTNLSKKQKRRMRCKSVSDKKDLQGNILEQTCSFCNHTTTTKSEKPDKGYPNLLQSKLVSNSTESNQIKKQRKPHKNKSKNQANTCIQNKLVNSPKINTNVYTNASDVFSLRNNCNTLPNTVKDIPKIIKNNKKRKDKFAGLCQKAVLASAKVKLDDGKKKTQNKLSLLLKPSSG